MTARIFTDGAMASTNTIYSKQFGSDSVGQSGGSAHVVWSGDPTGTFTVWASNKANASEADDTDWVEITAAVTGITNPTGSASKLLIRIPNTQPALKYRLKYVNSSGTGSVQGYAYAPSGR